MTVIAMMKSSRAGASGEKRRMSGKKNRRTMSTPTGIRPTSVRCRRCGKNISLDKRSRFYSGLWVKHRGKCPGILQIEKKKRTRRRDWNSPSNRERRQSATSSLDASGEDSDDGEPEEDEALGFSTSNVRFYNNCWERGASHLSRYMTWSFNNPPVNLRSAPSQPLLLNLLVLH
ncbi:hypothetical protein EDB19DRAFT_2024081 [Suillus lakei]|nr:hypothetical protein EDB19DRAFT_2024081 [Suillus lakei]